MSLPSVDFVGKTVSEIESSVITTYEGISGRTLYPGDPVRLFLQAIAVIIGQQRVLIDFAAKQNLLPYASGDYLDNIGDLVNVERLAAQKASTTLRFTLSAAQPTTVTIPQGSRASTETGVAFATTETVTIAPGSLYADVIALCTNTGPAGNGFVAGQIGKLVDLIPYVSQVANTTTTANGSDEESDDNFRDRIRQAPESFSVAGPVGAYQYFARTAHPDIADVAVYSPSPGVVSIRPLMSGGVLPTQEIIDLVEDACSANEVRPLTDNVDVDEPEVVDYNLSVTYYLSNDAKAQAATVQAAVTQAIADFVVWQKTKLGRDINPSELIKRVIVAGAKRCTVSSPTFTALEPYEVAIVDTMTVTFGGFEDD